MASGRNLWTAIEGRSHVNEVYEASDKAGDVAAVLGKAIEMLNTEVASSKSRGKLNGAAFKRVAEKLIQAQKASQIIREKTKAGAGGLAGSSGRYAHDRVAADKKRREPALEEGRPKRIGQDEASRSLGDFVRTFENTESAARMSARRNCGGGKENLRTNFKLPRPKPRPKIILKPWYPLPANGRQYTPPEATNILVTAKKVLPIIQDWGRLKLVPVGKSALYRLMKRSKAKLPIIDNWHNHGRPPLLSVQEVEGLVEKRTSGGNTIGVREMQEDLIRAKHATLNARGFSSVGSKPMSNKTAKNYLGLALEFGRAVESVPSKSVTRETAEHSLINAQSFAVTVGGSGIFPCKPRFPPPEGNFFDRIFRETFGWDEVCAVDPALLTSTDDCTFVCSEDVKAGGGREWRVASKVNSSTRGVYQMDPASQFTCHRIVGSFTMAGNGTLAPFVFTLKGLSVRELSVPFAVLPVPGLCIGGGVTPGAQPVGYICFVQGGSETEAGTQSGERQFCSWYRTAIMRPFVQANRANLGHVDGTPVPDDFTAVTWMDGAALPIAAVVDELSLEVEALLKIIVCKHCAASSATEQPCDLSVIFRVLKLLAATGTTTTPAQRSLRAKIKSSIQGCDELNLKDAQIKTVCDFLACVPDNLTKACTGKNIIDGFTSAGMLDKETATWPDFKNVLGTCRRPLLEAEVALCHSSYPQLLKRFLDDGWVDDEMYEVLGFPVDLNYLGEPIRRPAGITNEICQRSKCLSNPTQRRLRRDQEEKLRAKISSKSELANSKVLTVLSDNKSCELKLLELLAMPPTTSTRMLSGSTLAHFSACSAPHLKAFVQVRTFESIEDSRGHTWPKKGKLTEAAQGAEVTLIKQAFDLRKASVRLKAAVAVVAPQAMAQAAPLVITAAGATVPPSTWLKNALWLERVDAGLIGRRGVVCSDGERADLLERLASSRLERHMAQRVDPKKHDSWVFRLIRDNLGILAAIAVHFGHVAEDLKCASTESPLLADESLFVGAVGPQALVVQGCYLTWDKVRKRWVRSGKVTGTPPRSVGIREVEHVEGSMLATTAARSSLFYQSYPDEGSLHYSDLLRRGFRSSLSTFFGVVFDPTDAAAIDFICAPSPTNGIFYWSDEALMRLGNINFSGDGSLRAKQLHATGYLFEIYYDLLIAPMDNISRSPGFETCLGIFGNTE